MIKILLLVCSFLLSCTQPNPIDIDLYVEDKSNMADTILTDTPGWAELNVPTPGDPVKAALPDGAVRPGFQKLANRTAAFAYGYHSKPIRHRTTDTGPATTIRVESMGWIGLTTGGGATWELIEHAAFTDLDIVALAGALGLATRYYIYAYDNAGAVAFAINTTAPTSEGLYKTGAGGTDYFYIGTFSTDHILGLPNEYYADNGEYFYTRSPDQFVLSGGVAIVQTVVDMESATSRLVPTYATRVLLEIITQATVPIGTVELYPNGGTYSTAMIQCDNVVCTSQFLQVPVDGKIDYKVNAVTTSVNSLSVKGFHEPRK